MNTKQNESALTRSEIAARVRQIRHEIQEVKARYDGAVFDPRSLDVSDLRELDQMVCDVYPDLRPALNRVCDAIEAAKLDPGLRESVRDIFFDGIAAAYRIGILAGVIHGDCSSATADRFEQALIHAAAAQSTAEGTVFIYTQNSATD